MTGRNIAELRNFVASKSIALIGNSSEYVERPSDLLKHNIIVRINKGAEHLQLNHSQTIRTDILLVSGMIEEGLLNSAPKIVWMTPKSREKIPHAISDTLFYYPIPAWQRLVSEIGFRPSTGCMGIDLFHDLVGDGEVWLYGFDFWKSPTSYTSQNRPGPHNPESEEHFARSRIPEHRILRPNKG